jgi:hypothetical protein
MVDQGLGSYGPNLPPQKSEPSPQPGIEFRSRLLGNQPPQNPYATPRIVEWEYKDYVFTYTGGGARLSNFGGFTMAGARHEVWSQSQGWILPDLQEWMNQGWEPIGQIGPESLVFRTELRLSWLSFIIFAIFTAGLGLLLFFLFFDTWAIPVEFRVKMRRRK